MVATATPLIDELTKLATRIVTTTEVYEDRVAGPYGAMDDGRAVIVALDEMFPDKGTCFALLRELVDNYEGELDLGNVQGGNFVDFVHGLVVHSHEGIFGNKIKSSVPFYHELIKERVKKHGD